MIPLVSVIIPTYKRSEYIIRAINSVLNQTYKNIEIIVVDDNEFNDKFSLATQEKLEEFITKDQIIYLKHNNNKGVSAARNTGLDKAQGKYIAFLDDDDEFYPDKTKLQLDIFNNSKENVGLVYGACLKIDVDNSIEEIISPKLNGNVHDVLGVNHIGTPSMVMVSKIAIEKIKGFDVDLNHKEDIDFYYRLSEFFEFTYTSKIVTKYYLHPGSASKNDYDRLDKMLKFLKKHEIKMKKPRIRWSELQERLGELYIFNNNRPKAFHAFVLAYINRPLRLIILMKICLIFLGKRIFSFKKNLYKYSRLLKKFLRNNAANKF